MSQAQTQPRAGAGDASAPTVRVFVGDRDSEALIRQCLATLNIENAVFTAGSLAAATAALAKEKSPRLLILDVSGIEDPLNQLMRLAELCDPSICVIVIGDRSDITFYRELKSTGVADYFHKPLVRDLFISTCKAVLSPDGNYLERRTGKLVFVLGVRGGTGATTIATNLAWSMAESKRRHTMLVDLGLRTGDAALQLDALPSHALCDALGHPERVDQLFLERGLKPITGRLSLLASLEPLNGDPLLSEEAFLWLLDKLLPRYRVTIVELPAGVAMRMTWALRLPSTCILISNMSLAGARDLARWSDTIGLDTPERHTLHVVNSVSPHGGLSPQDFLRASGKRVDAIVPYSREIAEAACRGIAAMHKCASFQRTIAPILRDIADDPDEGRRSFLGKLLS
jgi:pilus assembly protein CpaE